MEFKDSETRICTARAFAGLCQDGARYQLMKKSAEHEGYGAISKLFNTFSFYKIAHATVLYKLIVESMKVKKDNVPIEAGYPFESLKLFSSIKGSVDTEAYEGRNLFPHFAKLAHDEGFLEIEKVFNQISQICLSFSKKLKILSLQFEEKRLYKSDNPIVWHCTNCGHEEKAHLAWKECPLCTYPQGYATINTEND